MFIYFVFENDSFNSKSLCYCDTLIFGEDYFNRKQIPLSAHLTLSNANLQMLNGHVNKYHFMMVVIFSMKCCVSHFTDRGAMTYKWNIILLIYLQCNYFC